MQDIDLDIFTPSVGTLDIIIYAVLNALGYTVPRFGDYPGSLDAQCEDNARRFIRHFHGEQIKAIKLIRETTGLNLRQARDAWKQAIHSYYGDREWHIDTAKYYAGIGDAASAAYYIKMV